MAETATTVRLAWVRGGASLLRAFGWRIVAGAPAACRSQSSSSIRTRRTGIRDRRRMAPVTGLPCHFVAKDTLFRGWSASG